MRNPESARKAYVSVVVDDGLVLNDIVIVEGKSGLFLSLPQKQVIDADGNASYEEIFKINEESKSELKAVVLEAYETALEK